MAIDSALGRLGAKAGVCTSSTRPTNPFEGQIVYETDTNRTLIYDNSAWLVIADNQVLSIDSTNERVGIGTTTPSTLLHVGDTAVSDNIVTVTAANNTSAGVDLMGDLSGAKGFRVKYEGDGNYFAVEDNTSGVQTERMRIDSNGNVGIGDTTPSYTLDVNGDINTTGALRTDGKKTGLVLLTSGDVSSGGPITFTSLFSSEFDNYIVYLSELTCTSQNSIYYRTASSGSWNTSSVYSNQRIYGQTASVGAQRFSSTYALIGYAGGRKSSYEVHFFSPYLSTQTSVMSRGVYSDNTNPGYIEMHHSYVDNTTSYDGFVFDEVTGAASISCRDEVYGIPK